MYLQKILFNAGRIILFSFIGVSSLCANNDTVLPTGQNGDKSLTNDCGTTVTITSTFVSEYMSRGVRLGGPSFEPCVEITKGNFTAGCWANFPMADRVCGQSDPEFDLYTSYTFQLNDSFSITPSVIAYLYPCANRQNGFFVATAELNIAANLTIKNLTITSQFYYDVIMEGPTFELTIAYAIPVPKLSTELDLAATIGTGFWDNAVEDASPRVSNYGSYYQVGVTLPLEISKHITITPGIAYTEGFCNYFKTGGIRERNTAATGRFVASMDISFSF